MEYVFTAIFKEAVYMEFSSQRGSLLFILFQSQKNSLNIYKFFILLTKFIYSYPSEKE